MGNIRVFWILKLITIFLVTLSLTSLAGPVSKNFRLPALKLADALQQSCQAHGSAGACSEFWYPAGPEMNTELATVFTDENGELVNLQSASPSIDLTDTGLTSSLTGTFASSPSFLESAPVPGGFDAIQFNLASNFWGCSFNFSNSACGIQIRQGIAHMIDKTSFTTNEVTLATLASPVDTPVPPTSAGGLPTANPCNWDSAFPETGGQCAVGASGGRAYNLGSATGAAGIAWLQAPGSPDLNAAAQHFVNAGLASGFNTATSVLTSPVGITCPSSRCPIFYVRNDNVALADLGVGLAEQICYLFTGSYAKSCSYLQETEGPVSAFPGFFTSTSSVSLNWSMYTGGSGINNAPYGFNDAKDPCGLCLDDPFDGSLYFQLNSRYVSGVTSIRPPSGPCSSQSLPSPVAPNYVYLCSPGYDSISSQMENAPCLTAQGDPAVGASSNLPTSPGNGLCSNTSQLSAISAGIQTEDLFGRNEFSIPVFSPISEFGYLNNGWSRIVNNQDGGIPNFFTWLNAHNPNPTQPGTIRQAMSQRTESVSPYIANTFWDMMIVGNIYDTLYAANPLDDNQYLNWMSTLTTQLTNSQVISTRGYTPPPGTVNTYEFTLHNDMFFQDQKPVTAFDVAFSYLSMVGVGSPLGSGAASMTGVTMLQTHQLDISVSSLGAFVLPNLTGVPIVPGRYWSKAGDSAWDAATTSAQNTYNTCGTNCPISQYTLSGQTVNCALTCTPFGPDLMTVDQSKIVATYDPIASHILVGSGPWQCGTVTSSGSSICSSTGAMNPPAGSSYTLTAFGAGTAPGACQQSTCYFRSSANLALYLWSEQNSVSPNSILSTVAFCVAQPPVPLSATTLTGSCAHFQQGIGTNGATTTTGSFSVSCVPTTPPSPEAISVCGTQTTGSVSWTCSIAAPCGFTVGVNQFSVQVRYYGVNWVQPFAWAVNNPTGIGSVTPVLYAPGPTVSGTTLNPASSAGCTSPFPTGGYDC